VALSGDTALVGAHYDDDAGSAYVFGLTVVIDGQDTGVENKVCTVPDATFNDLIAEVAANATNEVGKRKSLENVNPYRQLRPDCRQRVFPVMGVLT